MNLKILLIIETVKYDAITDQYRACGVVCGPEIKMSKTEIILSKEMADKIIDGFPTCKKIRPQLAISIDLFQE